MDGNVCLSKGGEEAKGLLGCLLHQLLGGYTAIMVIIIGWDVSWASLLVGGAGGFVSLNKIFSQISCWC
jgi:hypothetical protein